MADKKGLVMRRLYSPCSIALLEVRTFDAGKKQKGDRTMPSRRDYPVILVQSAALLRAISKIERFRQKCMTGKDADRLFCPRKNSAELSPD
ncbi:hypothetical protein IFU20_21415 [Pseudomonas viridiflava]|uniref:hypothetical protein n=1 Tax=Pseudomonas viridiflava TaxID=33069 RepID=UPI000F06A24C|nr:hypothetical protein [Pseudomonas viridiflava]MBD8188741.1 hypothetical protein [Pseudomonas viridiflava]MBD8201800.1 hypothetical protein [Pseudomonas viridiflava]MDY0937175.1 hypothetical protein [Pseudomonas viridiflava]MDY1012529.1 hypothetical protein [Pseudomonas viridiflava]